MTQEQLAQAADIGRPFISRIETGRFSVTLETVGALASALRASPADLIENYAA
jgi:transcriptional regulator with XRE-family HTH domain